MHKPVHQFGRHSTRMSWPTFESKASAKNIGASYHIMLSVVAVLQTAWWPNGRKLSQQKFEWCDATRLHAPAYVRLWSYALSQVSPFMSCRWWLLAYHHCCCCCSFVAIARMDSSSVRKCSISSLCSWSVQPAYSFKDKDEQSQVNQFSAAAAAFSNDSLDMQ